MPTKLRRSTIVTKGNPSLPPNAYLQLRDNVPDRYDVKLDSDDTVIATYTQGARTVLVPGPTRTFVEQITNGLQDDWNRTLTDKWGATDSAGAWAVRTGADSDFQVVPHSGKIIVDTVNTSKRIAPSSYGYNYSFHNPKILMSVDQAPLLDSLYMGLMMEYTDVSNHYLAMLEFLSVNMSESFGTDLANSWGSEDIRGKTWTNTGTSTDYSVTAAGHFGTHSHGTLNSSRRSTVSAVESDNGEVLTSFFWPTQNTGGSFFAGPILRYTDISNHYTVRLRKNYTGLTSDATLDVQKTVAGTTTTVTSVDLPGVVIPNNEEWWVRAQIYGNEIKARAWKTGDTEPTSWQIDITDNSLTTGARFGVRSITSPDLSNSLPIVVRFTSWSYNTKGDVARARLQKREAGSVTDIAVYDISFNTGFYRGNIADQWWIEAWRDDTDALKMRAWAEGYMSIPDWQIEITDSTFPDGDVGVRVVAQSGYTGPLPVTFSAHQYEIEAEWDNPTTITHDTWVYILDEPFDVDEGYDEDWLDHIRRHRPEDVLSHLMGYIANAPLVQNRSALSRTANPDTSLPNGKQIGGNAGYSHRDIGTGNGNRVSGADWNDYVDADIVYHLNPSGTTTDFNEFEDHLCLDCSGYTRMVMGIRNGIDLQLTKQWDNRIPRITSDIYTPASPGSPVIVAYTDDLPDGQGLKGPLLTGKLQIGDLLSFDATFDTDEEEGQIDHNGFYIGRDTGGFYRFVSSRKTVSGPHFGNVGGRSVVNDSDTNLYSKTLRWVSRF